MTGTLPAMSHRYGKVVVTSGHMIDAPDRATPRFPPGNEASVAAAVERVLDGWAIGPGDIVLNGGARGADILFAESARRRGADVELLLALEPHAFESASVRLADSIWVERFRDLLDHAGHRVVSPHDFVDTTNEFARANQAMIARARQLAPPAQLHIALIWDGNAADGPGGTTDFAELARSLDAPLAIIDPLRPSDSPPRPARRR